MSTNNKNKTIYLRLTPTNERWLNDKISSGKYKNASEVINDYITKLAALGY